MCLSAASRVLMLMQEAKEPQQQPQQQQQGDQALFDVHPRERGVHQKVSPAPREGLHLQRLGVLTHSSAVQRTLLRPPALLVLFQVLLAPGHASSPFAPLRLLQMRTTSRRPCNPRPHQARIHDHLSGMLESFKRHARSGGLSLGRLRRRMRARWEATLSRDKFRSGRSI
jgi:hypothetical protein